MSEAQPMGRGLRMLFAAAAVVVIVAGLREASSLIVPVVAAIFLAVVAMPPVAWLLKRGIPAWLAVSAAALGVVVVGVGAGIIGTRAIINFTDSIPAYTAELKEELAKIDARLAEMDIAPEGTHLLDLVDPGALMGWVGFGFGSVLALLRDGALVLVLACFLLMEAASFRDKVKVAFEADGGGRMQRVIDDMRSYLVAKTQTSLGTGILVWVLLWAFGVPYALALGLFTFALNFVPVIGAIMAGVPAVLLTLIEFGPGRALAVLIAYTVLNVVVGSVIEPKLFGKRLGLSAPIVLLSLVFWGWVLGPVGMLLCVPLTVLAKIGLDAMDELKWLSILMGPPVRPGPRP